METRLNAGPPRLLEQAVSILIPPMVREEVAGDLWERFRTPLRYLAEAAATLPFVVFSQARRATDGSLLALQIFTIFASFGGFEPTLNGDDVTMWQRASIATAAALAAIMLRNAYRKSDRWSGKRAASDLAAMLFAVLAVEGMLSLVASKGMIDRYWCLPVDFLVCGLIFSLVMVFVLRSGADLAPRSVLPVAPEVADLQNDYLLFRRGLRLKYAAEIGSLSVLLILVLLFSLTAKIPLISKVGYAWIALALPVTVLSLLRSRTPPMPPALGLDRQLSFYRLELVRQRADIGLARWFCFGPLFAGLGLNMIVRGLMNGWHGLALGGAVCIVLLGFMITQANRACRRQLAEKIAALERLDRLRSG